MAGWFGKPVNWPTQIDREQLKLEIERQKHAIAMQQAALAQQQYNQQLSQPTYQAGLYQPITGTGTTTPTNPYFNTAPGGITVTSTGTGAIFPQTVIQPINSYYVELPKEPREGDEVIVYYQNGRWLEKNNFSNRMTEEKPNGGFSLKEIEEAEKIMQELTFA